VSPLLETAADRRFRRFSGQGLALHGLAITFASIDWIMSLEPHWFSTIYGVLVFASQGLAALALAICVSSGQGAVDSGQGENGEPNTQTRESPQFDPLHDQGKLLLGFSMLWAYLAFSQFFIIWYGNLPEEVVWYLKRIEGGWVWLAAGLPLVHFAIPFVLLLGRELKRNPARLAAVAGLILAAHWLDTVWMIEPAIERAEGVSYFPWPDAALTAAIGGAWWLAFVLLLGRTSRRAEPMTRGGRRG